MVFPSENNLFFLNTYTLEKKEGIAFVQGQSEEKLCLKYKILTNKPFF